MYKHQIPAEVLARRIAVGTNVTRRRSGYMNVDGLGSQNRNKANRERIEIDRHAIQQPGRMALFPTKSAA